MQSDFYGLLACPKCKGSIEESSGGFSCLNCGSTFSRDSDILYFVKRESYSSSFGFQWNRFEKAQLDSFLGTDRSRVRFQTETGWNEKDLAGQFVLDAGSGAGRFAEVALSMKANLLSVDFSNAVRSSSKNLLSKGNLLTIQSDLQYLPLKSDSIKFIYCIGVLQHTKSPKAIIAELLRVLEPNGTLVVTYYSRNHWYTKLHSKYFVRTVTKHISPKLLLAIISGSAKVWFPLTSFLFTQKLGIGKFFRFIIPVANYVEFEYLTRENHRNESILDTFDMLSPRYDHPFTQREIINFITSTSFDCLYEFVEGNPGTIRVRKLSK
jgi:ubiquinone/menaquinone biosynthesis C-methylase UbiE